jgi:molecular chaperone DnaK
MKREAKENESRDKEQRERVDKLNAADSLIFQTEKQLKEFGDKLPADKKGPIEQALAKLKDAHKSQDLASLEKATAELNAVWQAASEELYKNQQPGGQESQQGYTADAGQPGSSAGQQAGGKKDDEVTDVDFEEVK